MSLDQLDLNLLRPLHVLLETKNVTRAGERLHLSQSAMSATLRRLRRAFDDPLLIRQGRELVLTPFAESLVEPVASLLDGVNRLADRRPRFDASSAQRTFVLMASDYAALVLAPALTKQMALSAPHCRLDIRELSDNYRQVLRRDEVDVLLISGRIHDQDLPEYPSALVFTDEFRLCGSGGNASLRADLTPSQFEQLPYVEYGPGGLVGLAERGLRAAGVTPNVEVRTENQVLVPALLHDTDLVAHLPSRLLRAPHGEGLKDVAPVVELPTILQCATWHPSRAVDTGHAWFVELLSSLEALGSGPQRH